MAGIDTPSRGFIGSAEIRFAERQNNRLEPQTPQNLSGFGTAIIQRLRPDVFLMQATSTAVLGLTGEAFSVLGLGLARSFKWGRSAQFLLPFLFDEGGSACLTSINAEGGVTPSNVGIDFCQGIIQTGFAFFFSSGGKSRPGFLIMSAVMFIGSLAARLTSHLAFQTVNPFQGTNRYGMALEFLDTMLVAGVGKGRKRACDLEQMGHQFFEKYQVGYLETTDGRRLPHIQLTVAEDESGGSRRLSRREEERLAGEGMVLVRRIAHRLIRGLPPELNLDDLISAGNAVLPKVIRNYDPGRGSFEKFAAPRIKGEMLDELRRMDSLGRDIRAEVTRIGKTRRDLHVELGREATPEEVALRAGVSVDRLEALRLAEHEARPASLEDDHDWSDGRGVQDLRAQDAREKVSALFLARDLMGIMNPLSNRERLIIKLSLEGFTQEEIGRKLDLHSSRVCQLRGDAVRKVRAGLVELGYDGLDPESLSFDSAMLAHILVPLLEQSLFLS